MVIELSSKVSRTNAISLLREHSEEVLHEESLFSLFSQDPNRADKFSKSYDGFFVDYSKQLLTENILKALFKLAAECDLKACINNLISGAKVNPTENRPALHTALRLPPNATLTVDGGDVVEPVHKELNKVKSIVQKIHAGQWRGFSGKAVTDIVNIGVGGSDLGPFMVVNALKEFKAKTAKPLNFHFVSSMDGTQLFKILNNINPEKTLFIVSSKSFTTIDTFYNANTALKWMRGACKDEQLLFKQHFIGISSKPKKMSEWGISSDNQLLLWDWVGGRFSMWSSIGLTIALSIGFSAFKELLAGAHSIDKHFLEAELEDNLPVLLGMIGVWNASFLNINAHTILPYDGRLEYFPNYLTQLEMESNGKAVNNDGKKVDFKTCPILWGDIGPNAQHAFYQLLHQGTQRVSCDFITPINRYLDDEQLKSQHQLALANCLAQSRVLAFGNDAIKQDESIPKYKLYNGNQPSTTVLIDELTPYSLGGLIALYEHKVFVMASIWDINPFDQWGVEVGKVISNEILQHLNGKGDTSSMDTSTAMLLMKIKYGLSK